MRSVFNFLAAFVVLGLVMYTCTSGERDKYDIAVAAKDANERYSDEVDRLAEEIRQICIDHEGDDTIDKELLDSIYRIADDITYCENRTDNILDSVISDHLRLFDKD